MDGRIIPAGPLYSYQLARGAVRESNSAQGEGGHEEKEEGEEEGKKNRAHGEEAARNERFEVGAIRQVSSDVVGYARNKGGAERNRGGEARVETRLAQFADTFLEESLL